MNKKNFIIPYYFSLILGVGLSIISLILFQVLLSKNNQQIQKNIKSDIATIHQEILNELDEQVLDLVETSKKWQLDSEKLQLQLEETNFIDNFKGYEHIKWIDKDLKILLNFL